MMSKVAYGLACVLLMMAILAPYPSPATEDAVITGPLGTRYFWEGGFRIDSPNRNLKLKLNGEFAVDAGRISADDELEAAFPDMEGGHADLRTLKFSLHGYLASIIEFKVSIDFANVRQVKDNWFNLPNVPLLKHFKIGNQKEPYSLENLTSGRFKTFMEDSLPTYAFTPGRNIGVRTDNAVLEERMTWSAGLFLSTGSLSTVGDTKDEISEANGVNLTGRVTGLPWYEEEGRRLLHLGLSGSYQFRDDTEGTSKTYPESRLTDDKLVDTGEFLSSGNVMLDPEIALVYGPLSLQGEFFVNSVDRSRDRILWGYYGYASLFLTGEHRVYNRYRGIFTRVVPKREFPPWDKGWGALDLGLRLSYIDLNDGDLRGGEERNITAGLNWYFTEQYRLMFNYINVRVTDRANPPAVQDGREEIFAARFAYWF